VILLGYAGTAGSYPGLMSVSLLGPICIRAENLIRSSPRKRGPSSVQLDAGVSGLAIEGAGTTDHPKHWVPAFAGMSGD